MLRHAVLFRWSDGTTDEQKEAVSAGLDQLAGLDCIGTFTHGPNAGLVDGNWDYSVVADFADADAYGVYATDAGHLALIADVIKPVISARAGIQFEL